MDLKKRFQNYFSVYYLKRVLNTSKSIICNSLFKNGYGIFQLEILEYRIFPSAITIKEKKKVLLEKEQSYIDLLKPKYNICKVAGSTLGKKPSLESKKLMKEKALGRNPSKGYLVYIYIKCDLITEGVPSATGFKFISSFVSIRIAAKYKGVHESVISKCIKNNKTCKGYVVVRKF